jgi:hypothetical protein
VRAIVAHIGIATEIFKDLPQASYLENEVGQAFSLPGEHSSPCPF